MPKLFTLPLRQVNKYILAAYCRDGREGVILRWTLRGEYASCCKNLVNLQLCGFSPGTAEPWEAEREAVYLLPRPLTFTENKRNYCAEVLLNLPTLVISSPPFPPPPPPPHCFGKFEEKWPNSRWNILLVSRRTIV